MGDVVQFPNAAEKDDKIVDGPFLEAVYRTAQTLSKEQLLKLGRKDPNDSLRRLFLKMAEERE